MEKKEQEAMLCEGCGKIFGSRGGLRKHQLFHHPELTSLSEEELERQRENTRKNWRRCTSPARMVKGSVPTPLIASSSNDLDLTPRGGELSLEINEVEPVSPALPGGDGEICSTSQMDVLEKFVLDHPSCDFSSVKMELETLMDRKFDEEEYAKIVFAMKFLSHHLGKVQRPCSSRRVSVELFPETQDAMSPIDMDFLDLDPTEDLAEYLMPMGSPDSVLDAILWADL